MKLCINCKYQRFAGDEPYECAHEKSIIKINPVNGYVYYRTCIFMREGYSESGGGLCGKNAVLFEQKKPWWKLW